MEGRDDMGKASEAKLRANAKYQKKAYDTITIISRREDRLREQIDFASTKLGLSKTQYIIESIKTRLARDGISIDMLPADAKYTPPEPEPKQPKQYMVYMITEQYKYDDPALQNKYIACFPTLKAAEKYAKGKLDKKAYPADWVYTIYGRNVEGNNKTEAWNTLKALIWKEVEEDKRTGLDEDTPNYLDRINDVYPVEYTGEIKDEDGLSSEDFLEEIDLSDWFEEENSEDE